MKKNINIISRLQQWMDTTQGKTFLNYAYSWGASIVILGTLFKLTHLPGANTFLFLGMGTEVFVFFIAAFDRPFDMEETDLIKEKEEVRRVKGVQTKTTNKEWEQDIIARLIHENNLSQEDEISRLRQTLTAVNTAYETQLNKAQRQLDAMDEVLDKTTVTSKLLAQINEKYRNVIEALQYKKA